MLSQPKNYTNPFSHTSKSQICKRLYQKITIQPSNINYDSKLLKQQTEVVAVSAICGLLLLPQSAHAANHLYEIAGMDASTAALLATILRPLLAVGQLLMISRIVLSWYPQIDTSKLPWAVSYLPTEPVLSITRKIIKPVAGVDVSPIVWFALLSFSNEILIGPQGILNLIQEKGGI
eukprot:TRINITY_DN4142_c1_g1_i3.p2 TRINITY_DN4142_c1_g1~~TRINITY_DN4142_c1_g1_i3.p2  ORF type:complete len:190 (-),score=6.15 TRINITY_DN4142_c1_g1_i3:251-781(-)